MKSLLSFKAFKKFAHDYQPFPWEINLDTPQKDIRGKHSVLISIVRYWYVLNCLFKLYHADELSSVLDIGSYPGNFLKIIRSFFGKNVNYFGIGLGFSSTYKQEIDKLGGIVFETELDPTFVKPKAVLDWPFSGVDACIFLDVIEHLTSPIDCLDRINNSLKMGGKVILTTDNITSLGYVSNMIKRGESPNIHPVRSNLFYTGDWRPHFKEFSRDELFFLFEFCGFKVIDHQYFERQQGDYYFGPHGDIVKYNRHSILKRFVYNQIVDNIPHLRDHQILIAEKIVDSSIQKKFRAKPTDDMQEWLKIRQQFGL